MLDKHHVKEWVESHHSDFIHLLSELIRLPSENVPPRGYEKPVQQCLADYLSKMGLSVELYELGNVEGLFEHPQYWPGRDYRDRPNLFACKKGVGGGRSLLFAVHADVVPGIQGVYQPFEPVVYGNKLYGRGSNDMKGGIVAALLAFRYLDEHGIRLKGDLLFESVVDEEVGGANGTLAGRLRGDGADVAIVPEPTNLKVCSSHTGGITWRISIRGKGGMGFGGEEVANPVYAMAAIVSEIERYAEETGCSKVFRTPSGSMTVPNIVLSTIHAGSFEPGMADGVPESCAIEVWVECMPDETKQDLEKDFKARMNHVIISSESYRKFEVTWEQTTRFLYGSKAQTPLTEILLPIASRLSKLPEEEHMAPFACDAFLFNVFSNTPAIILGPAGENAHGADECVEITSLLVLTRIYIETIIAWCGIAAE